MNIIQRNFFRLLRCGAFKTTEQLEPMSVFKWDRLCQLAVMHNVVLYVYDGLQQCKGQFFLKLTENQWNNWQKLVNDTNSPLQDVDSDEFLRADHLTNPLLNHKLQDILDDEKDQQTFMKWINGLRLQPMCQLEGEFLMLLLGFTKEELFFIEEKANKNIEKIALELIEFTNTRSQDWYFSQDSDSIFVHNSNTSAMFSHVRRSARYFRYYPSESVTNFFASFAHSLSHIEE